MARLNIEGHLHRLVHHNRREQIWTRHYARIETAIQRCTLFLMMDGHVGDLIEFTVKINGYQVGTIRLKATGKIEVNWNRDPDGKDRNTKLLPGR
jgi:hypothetical protein